MKAGKLRFWIAKYSFRGRFIYNGVTVVFGAILKTEFVVTWLAKLRQPTLPLNLT